MKLEQFPFGTKVRVTGVTYGQIIYTDRVGTIEAVIPHPSGDYVRVKFANGDRWSFSMDGSDGVIEPIVEAPALEQASASGPMISEGSPTIDKVLAFLTSGKTLTQGEALLLGFGTRLASHIDRLRKRGHKINMVLKRDINGRTYGEYSLATRDRFGNLKKAA